MLQPMGLQRVRHDLATEKQTAVVKGQLCRLEDSLDTGESL